MISLLSVHQLYFLKQPVTEVIQRRSVHALRLEDESILTISFNIRLVRHRQSVCMLVYLTVSTSNVTNHSVHYGTHLFGVSTLECYRSQCLLRRTPLWCVHTWVVVATNQNNLIQLISDPLDWCNQNGGCVRRSCAEVFGGTLFSNVMGHMISRTRYLFADRMFCDFLGSGGYQERKYFRKN